MRIVYPLKDGDRSLTANDLYTLNQDGKGGWYPVGSNQFWHAGIHLDGENKKVCAIADGTIVAYRITKKYLPMDEDKSKYTIIVDGEPIKRKISLEPLSNCFILMKHQYETPNKHQMIFYSLYNHLLPLDEYSEKQKDAYPTVFKRWGCFVKRTNGIPLRKGLENSSEFIKKIPENTELDFENPNEVYNENGQLIATGRRHIIKPQGTVYVTDANVKTERILAPTFDSIQTEEKEIKAGELLGYTGKTGNYQAKETVHFEIFAKDVGFLDNPEDDGDDKQKTTIKIAKTKFLKKKQATPVFSNLAYLPKNTKVKLTTGFVTNTPHTKKSRNVQLYNLTGWVKWKDLTYKGEDTAKRKYYVTNKSLNHMCSNKPATGTPTTLEKDIRFTITTGAKVYLIKSDGTTNDNSYRKVEYILSETEQRRYQFWVEDKDREGLKYQGSTSKLYNLSKSLKNEINKPVFFTENPEIGKFIEPAVRIDSKPYNMLIDFYIEKKYCKTCLDIHEKTWYEIPLHKIHDGQIWYDPNVREVSRITPGWIREDDVEFLSPFDWPGFYKLEEPSFFTDKENDYICDLTDIIKLIDENDDKAMSITEIQEAVKEPNTRDRLRALVVKHPSEWHCPDDKLDDICERIKEAPWNFKDDKYEAHKHLIKTLSFLDQIDDFKDDGLLWFFHPIAFVQHFKRLSYRPYGGYELQLNDKDSEKKWGGAVQSEDGAYVKELQKDLLKLGYWISSPTSKTGKGMLTDGEFGSSVENAVKTFQLEHLCLKDSKDIDNSKLNLITGKVDSKTANKIKEQGEKIGSKKWLRPVHKAIQSWKLYGISKTGSSREFYQVTPSKGYYRVSVDYGKNNEYTWGKRINNIKKYKCKCFEVIENKDFSWLIADSWGTKEMVQFLRDVGDEWYGKIVSIKTVPPFMIGDTSSFKGGPLYPHNSHQDGTGVDTNGVICSTRDFTEAWHRDCAVELAKLFKDKGAKRILFNCHYVIKKVSIVQQLVAHHHHFHVDGPGSSASPLTDRYTTCHQCGLFSSCDKKINRVRKDSSSDWQDYNRDAEKGSSEGLYASGGGRTKGVVKLSQVED